MKKITHSKVMTIANRLIAQGYNRSNAVLKAWVLVKMPLIETKVSGVTYGKRQKAIENLGKYNPEDITITLVRDTGNAYDRNSIAVYATVSGKGSYCMGYLPRSLAVFIAPLMDAKKGVQSSFKRIRKYKTYLNYGLGIEVRI